MCHEVGRLGQVSGSCEGVRVGRGSICTSLCLLRRELSNEWHYHGVSMCEDGDGVRVVTHLVQAPYISLHVGVDAQQQLQSLHTYRAPILINAHLPKPMNSF